jgi:diguanylate cyclase (GGDEF)-like protein/PAS domain S-box-containing protein
MNFAFFADWVQIRSEFAERLRMHFYDVIICEYSMPRWTGLEALDLLNQVSRDIPFIVAGSNLDEDTRGAFLQRGAFDCVDKTCLNRLPLAVGMAIEEKSRREERDRAEKELLRSVAYYRALTNNPGYGFCHFDSEGRFLEVNEALVTMLGYGSKEELMAANLSTEIIRDPIERAQLFESYRRTGHVDLIEVAWKRKDGKPMKVHLSGLCPSSQENSSEGCAVIVEDVTAQRATEENLGRLAATDALTGLEIYRRLTMTLESEINRSERTRRAFALLIFGLHGTKRIKDGHSHLDGNRDLCRLADILRFACRSIDTASRYGANEFALILPETSAKETEAVARRIRELLSSDREEPLLSVSIGIAVYPEDGTTVEALLQSADRALYTMKQEQKAV